MAKKTNKAGQYVPIIAHVFRKYWSKGSEEFEFHRDELVEAAQALRVARPDNLGDVIYSFRYRRELPAEILQTAPRAKPGSLKGRDRAAIAFALSNSVEIRSDRAATSPQQRSRTPRRRLLAHMPWEMNRLYWQKFATTG